MASHAGIELRQLLTCIIHNWVAKLHCERSNNFSYLGTQKIQMMMTTTMMMMMKALLSVQNV